MIGSICPEVFHESLLIAGGFCLLLKAIVELGHEATSFRIRKVCKILMIRIWDILFRNFAILYQ